MSDEASTKPEAEIVDDPEWREGDMTIISSDHVRFVVPSYHLLSASLVLAAASPAQSGEKVIEFTDKTIETAGVIRKVLQGITTGTFGGVSSKHPEHVTQFIHLIAFLDKYECRALQGIMVSTLQLILSTDGLAAFVLAANMGDVALAGEALQFWDNPGLHKTPRIEKSGGIPAIYWQLISGRFLWAAAHCWLETAKSETGLLYTSVFKEYIASAQTAYLS